MIDFSKPVQTKKGGGKVTVLARYGDWLWLEDGAGPSTWSLETAEATLINVPEPVVSWHNVYRSGIAYGYGTHKEADKTADNCRLALLKLTYSPGHATVEIVEERK
ncbi:MAG: hypothetical protein WC807_22070 [Hyphomicrobium sp.]|jgi:hypothetical protein